MDLGLARSRIPREALDRVRALSHLRATNGDTKRTNCGSLPARSRQPPAANTSRMCRPDSKEEHTPWLVL